MSKGGPQNSDYFTGDPVDDLGTLSWYHGNLSRHAAEALLLSNGKDGSYLLRNSHKGPSFLALSARAKDSVKHFQVLRRGHCYSFGFNIFPSLRDFVHHFANEPLIGSETGALMVLTCPYPRAVAEPPIYESVRVHTAMQTGRSEKDMLTTVPSFATKEGYLVKQGAIIKNWKTRWFTLNRNELKYFKDKKSEEPIRTLDLTTCSAAQFDYSKKRVNCFCLVFPERTFYLCAQTGTEADEWLTLLQWKLSQIRKYLRQKEVGEGHQM
ncbi:dual adapter for phosphotyrosine and 3-phosphotyrosine and 3-phosphoinositide-like [Megalops cyprinoides]|uniref:dual adapter for phosphotyrosine and 3-phosphotyrosine and 3-phosphoinositide-like n=1 Tax=Megalops cyprinoides TaxID=118141 RepID=UPI00186422CC|nr:dual adapter for phosphotyrosine and 3-phosphotyrosine and 3-phosphoinositide-like [Megalops cyprinoides]